MPTCPPLPFALADGPAEGFSLLSIWHEVSLFNRGIIILLLLLLLLQVYVAVERGVLYLQSAAASRRLSDSTAWSTARRPSAWSSACCHIGTPWTGPSRWP